MNALLDHYQPPSPLWSALRNFAVLTHRDALHSVLAAAYRLGRQHNMYQRVMRTAVTLAIADGWRPH